MGAFAALQGGPDRAAFISRFGGVYEHNPWVAAAVYDGAADGDTAEALAAAMREVVETAPEAARLTLLRAQSDPLPRLLAQAHWPDAEAKALQRLVRAYSARFDLPFVIEGGTLAPAAILERCAERMGNARTAEFREALDEVHRLAWVRLAALTAGG
jgi:2-oxo-4-hydroxy-4-carboxy--5-ureidoimidazoline (OHCU) decarboxylase